VKKQRKMVMFWMSFIKMLKPQETLQP
jgi:hypothetical protein